MSAQSTLKAPVRSVLAAGSACTKALSSFFAFFSLAGWIVGDQGQVEAFSEYTASQRRSLTGSHRTDKLNHVVTDLRPANSALTKCMMCSSWVHTSSCKRQEWPRKEVFDLYLACCTTSVSRPPSAFKSGSRRMPDLEL